MKEMIKRMREREEGFTLAELLIVVAIVAVLVAIAIPVFMGQLAKAQVATDEANCRSLYGALQADILSDPAKYASETTPVAYAKITDEGKTIEFPDGQTAKLTQGTVAATTSADGATVTYTANDTVKQYVSGNPSTGVTKWGK